MRTSILLTVLITSCSIVREQSNLLAGLRNPETESSLTLLKDVEIRQTRGIIKTDYYSFIGKGEYQSVFESDSGVYYYAISPEFESEKHDNGGIFVTKNEGPKYFVWTNLIINEQKFLKKLSNPKFTKRLKWFTNYRRPFVHQYYPIDPANCRIDEL